MKPIKLLARDLGDGNPVIAEEFIPGRGWRRVQFRKRASQSWLRKLRAKGVTLVSLTPENTDRHVDYQVRELL